MQIRDQSHQNDEDDERDAGWLTHGIIISPNSMHCHLNGPRSARRFESQEASAEPFSALSESCLADHFFLFVSILAEVPIHQTYEGSSDIQAPEPD
jgi:hypothetical protein